MLRQQTTCILLSRDLDVIAIEINGNLIQFFQRDKIRFQRASLFQTERIKFF